MKIKNLNNIFSGFILLLLVVIGASFFVSQPVRAAQSINYSATTSVNIDAGINPAPPLNVTATSTAPDEVSISWTSTTQPVDGYKIYYKLSSDPATSSYHYADQVSYASTTIVISNFVAGIYDFMVRAFDQQLNESSTTCASCHTTNISVDSGPINPDLTIITSNPTTEKTINLAPLVTNGSEMYISGDVDAADAIYGSNVNQWLPYNTSIFVTLTSGDATKNISIKYRVQSSISSSTWLETATVTKQIQYHQTPSNVVLPLFLQNSVTEAIAETAIDLSTRVAVIAAEALQIFNGNLNKILADLGIKRNLPQEIKTVDSYINDLRQGVAIDSKSLNEIIKFITYGSNNTLTLGEGERAGVLFSYKEAYDKLPRYSDPQYKNEWSDVLKIATGNWPSEISKVAEAQAAIDFNKIFQHAPELASKYDENTIKVMTYGIRPEVRSLAKEAAAIKTFASIYKSLPSSTRDWNIIRAIAYGGSSRNNISAANNSKSLIGALKSFLLSRMQNIQNRIKAILGIKISREKTTAEYLKDLEAGLNIDEQCRQKITNDINTGDAKTIKLGRGERASVIYSYKLAYNRLPGCATEIAVAERQWQDKENISLGDYPAEKVKNMEIRAKGEFQKIYQRQPNLNNQDDLAAVYHIAYGVRPKIRDLARELEAIDIFTRIYKFKPQNTYYWNVMRAMAYSNLEIK